MITVSETFSEIRGRETFRTHLRPYLAELLESIGLDVIYHRGKGDYLFTRDETGAEREVLDLLGGYGVCLFGHNHPELVDLAKEMLSGGRPFASQASARSYAGLLAERLSEMVKRVTGRDYITTLGSTGTEVVEAAIKHAELEAVDQIKTVFDRQKRTFREIRSGLTAGTVTVPAGLFKQAEKELDVPQIADLDTFEYYLTAFNQQKLMQESCFLALEGAFHGKTSGSVKLTYNPDFRNPRQRIGIPVHFLPLNDAEALRREVETRRVIYYELVVNAAGEVELREAVRSQITACFIEPIQGEGGIRELEPQYLQALRAAADREGYPLVIDEIQSGMGRSGAFLASEIAGIAGDYYTFSKALGGGLAKIGALLVRKDRYREPFGYLHTSTFADDDFSSAIALGALDLLERDGRALVRACREKGDYLLEKLRGIQSRYPEVIKDVRGRGLMLGIELAAPAQGRSPLLRVLAEQKLLGFLVSGYLLNVEHIRIAPTVSAHGTIRVEPSAYISYEALDRFCAALERAACYIGKGHTHQLVAFLAGRQAEPVFSWNGDGIHANGSGKAVAEAPIRIARKVAFLGHFIEPQDLLHWDPSLAPLSAEECSRLLARTQSILEPFLVNERSVRSAEGHHIGISVIGLPYTGAQIMDKITNGTAEEVIDTIQEAVDLAREMGCTMVSFGGYTSIITQNCTVLAEDRIGLTSGNSLTAAAVLEALKVAAEQADIDPATARLGIVGAMGNIGRVLAEIEAERFGRIVLFGRPGAQRRLERVAEALYLQAWQAVLDGRAAAGIAAAMAATQTVADLKFLPPEEITGTLLRERLAAELGGEAPVQLSTDLHDLRRCQAIITATNAPQPLIFAEHLGDHPTVICDVAVPGDVDRAVRREKPGVEIIKGGVIEYPFGQKIDVGGMSLPGGQAYACLTEAVLLGLAGIREHFSYGPLEAQKVRHIAQIARQHGFRIVAKI